ncbi:MAG: tetratricopeptide repeat protein, partial [Clostridia bacterium]|nr:tetratricopeptide repeat protein [Clostridia bacterium]
MAIENFIRNVSDKFEEAYNIKLQPLLCENFDDAYTTIRKQEEYNEKIRESEFCFFIFFTKVGEYTREEFDVAREQFEKTGSPKIYTYFKIIEDGSGEDSLYAFMEELEKTFGHYYGTFSHIDTIKLRILLSLKLKEMDFIEIKTEDGECVVDGKRIMPLNNVAEFANNEELKKLTDELAKVEAEYCKLKPLYEKGKNDADFYKKYSAVASRRQYLIDEIEELQKLILTVSLRMVEDDTHGTITERQKTAYRLFEQGDYEGCMSVLNSEDIDTDFLRDMKRLEEQKIAVCRKYIREHKTAIDILGAMKAYDKRFEEIEERYKKIIPYILELKIDIETAGEYVHYLINQGKDGAALPVAEQLIEMCEDEVEKAYAYHLLGIIYENLNKAPDKAEEYYLKAIGIYEKLASENPDRYNSGLATSYNSAGVFYDDRGQQDKAEEYYLKAMGIREKLAFENPDRYEPDLAMSYNSAGVFYDDQGQPDKAEEYYL